MTGLAKINRVLNFSQGIDTKTDPYQVPFGKFLSLVNSIFQKGGLLSKRNGYAPLPSLPNASSTFATTFSGNLTAIGIQLNAYSPSINQWISKGTIQPVNLSTIPIIRNNTNQSQSDSAMASNGLICTVYTDQNPSNLSASIYRYTVSDSTGQTVIAPTTISGADATYGTPRVFAINSYFIIVYTNLVSATYHLKFLAISVSNPSVVTAAADISTSYTPSTNVAFDGVVFNGSVYLAWNGASSSGIRMAYIASNLTVSSSVNPDSSHSANIVSVCADQINNVVWVSYYSTSTSNGYTFVVNQNLHTVLAVTQILSSSNGVVVNINSSAMTGTMSLVYEVTNAYGYDSGIPTNFIQKITVAQSNGSIVGPSTVLRSVGLASKSFILNTQIYFLVVYKSPYQTTYFLTDINGNIIAKFAYGNGSAYLTHGLPSVSLKGSTAVISYLFTDLIQPVNKNTNVPSGSQIAGVYSQLGINIAFLNINSNVLSAEIGNNLNLSGGFLWGYDGYIPTEQGFFLWPDSCEVTTTTSGGSIANQQYFYQFTYEWSDNQGNLFRSAPSIPITVTTTGSNVSSNTLYVPTLRLTYKTANPVKIVGYRWSAAQQVYYQFTSIITPILNSPGSDYVTIVDTLADSSILGNNVLYTTGGVLEDTGGPALDSVFLFDDRLFGITSEDKNLLNFSKQVIEGTPVEMSDLLSIYVAPNIGAQGPTGPLLCGAAMDDKAILFKASAINYFAGTGPDNTGANSQYTQPIFITSTVGCSNQKSIIFQPQGLMFEFSSEAGNQIWLLRRDLVTEYIGAPVEALTQNANVLSAVNIPGTNQVRFTLDSGITLMYDYYYGQWGTFENIPAISSTLYNGLHTYINSFGQVFQESPGKYLDNTSPVLMSFATSWINLAGLQGYQRAYLMTFLGTYYSPHKLNIQISYDYNLNSSSTTVISPNNFAPTYGQDLTYGSGSTYGGASNLEQWRVFFSQQRCQSVLISVNEVYDPSYGVASGKGFSLSGINFVIGIKKGYRPFKAATSAGAS